MKANVRLRTFHSRAELNSALTERLAQYIEHDGRGGGPAGNASGAAVTQGATGAAGGAALMLSGGATPLKAYRALGQRRLAPLPGLQIFYSDERYVPITSDASNYHSSRPLLDALALPEERILRVRTELPLERAAEDYALRLRALLSGGTRIGLGLLGLGADGHTASLFSEADLRRAHGQLAITVQRPDGRSAVSVTPQLLKHVIELVFVIAGADKRAALEALVDRKPESIAGRAIARCPSVEIWADREAWPASG